jgi:diguanylate cyclase (GGDEF)-like protein
MVDVDFFKQVNDAYGHPCGDLVLRELARIFKKTVRATDIVGRYGGDELAVVLLETQKDMALKISEKLRREVEKYPFKWEGEPFQVTVSIGAASAFEKGSGIEYLLMQQTKLCIAKAGKRNTVVARAEPDTLQLDLFETGEETNLKIDFFRSDPAIRGIYRPICNGQQFSANRMSLPLQVTQ